MNADKGNGVHSFLVTSALAVTTTAMATETDEERVASGAHAAGWALRWRKHLGAPLHAIARPFHRAIWVLSAALVGALGLFGGTAYAYLSASGSGSGTATAGTLQPVAITATAAPTGTLLPGGSADLALKITNPNPFTVTLTGLSAGVGVVAVTGTAGCTAANATVSVTAKTGLAIPLAPGVNTVHIVTGAAMGTHSASACQHATFSIPVKLTVRQ